MISTFRAFAVTALLISFSAHVLAADGWSDDFAASQKKASTEGKSLLIDFTGSDWCGWCIRLRKEVFDQAGFREAAEKNFVLVELDYPKDKSILSAETIKQNADLSKRFLIKGYPTILLCDETGVPFASTGYQEGGLKPYLTSLNGFLADKVARDELLEKAKLKTGLDRAVLLSEALDHVHLSPELIEKFYGDLKKEVLENDPDHKTTLGVRLDVSARLETFSAKLKKLQVKKELAKINDLTAEILNDPSMGKDEIQRIHLMHGDALMAVGENELGYAAIQRAIDMDPESKKAEWLRMFLDTRKKKESPTS